MGACFHEERLRCIHPQLLLVVETWKRLLPFPVLICCGARGDAEQLALWHSGRDAAGNLVDKSLWRTNAQTTEKSPHGFRWIAGQALACAIDARPCSDRGLTDLGPKDEEAKLAEMARMARTLSNVVWGGDWNGPPDPDHFEVAGWRLYTACPASLQPKLTVQTRLDDPPDFSDVVGGSSTWSGDHCCTLS
jgi:hypothetical protein